MKYRLLENTTYEQSNGNLLETLLKRRGVEDIDALLNVSEKDVHDPFLMKNMKEAVELLSKHIKLGSKIVIVVDSDNDGYTSASIMWMYIKKNFDITCNCVFHEGKQHGIVMEELESINYDFDFLIVPDGGSDNFTKHRQLKNAGKDILILDHHSVSHYSEDALVVNPYVNDSTDPNPTLSGAGVVYKFCQALDKTFGLNDADTYLDLVSLGIIGDNMDLRNLETRYLALEGIKLLENDKLLAEQNKPTKGNKFIRAIVEKKKDRDLKNINFTSIGWKIAPMINGTIRAGKMEEKIDMFKAMIEMDETRIYQPRRKKKTDPKPEPIEISLQEDMVRVCTNVKGRQDRAVKKGKEQLDELIELNNLNDGKVLIVDSTDFFEESTYTGLVANKLASEYKKPVILLKKWNDETFGGSCRNFSMSPIESLKDLINETGIAKGTGHSNAHGIKVPIDKIDKLKNKINKQLRDVEMTDTYLVDFEIPVGRLKKEDVTKVGSMKNIWGNTLSTPLICVKDIVLNVNDIELIGERKNILKFKKHDMSFVKFYSNQRELDKIKCKNREGFGKNPTQVTITVICEFEVNEWENKEYPSVLIKDFNSIPRKEVLF